MVKSAVFLFSGSMIMIWFRWIFYVDEPFELFPYF